MINPKGCSTMNPLWFTARTQGGANLRTYKKSFNHFCSSEDSQSHKWYNPLFWHGQHDRASSSFLAFSDRCRQRFQSQWDILNGKLSFGSRDRGILILGNYFHECIHLCMHRLFRVWVIRRKFSSWFCSRFNWSVDLWITSILIIFFFLLIFTFFFRVIRRFSNWSFLTFRWWFLKGNFNWRGKFFHKEIHLVWSRFNIRANRFLGRLGFGFHFFDNLVANFFFEDH